MEGSEVLDLELLGIPRHVGGVFVHEENNQRIVIALVGSRKGEGHSPVFKNLAHLQIEVVEEAGEW